MNEHSKENKYITLEEFSKIELRIGKVVSAENVPNMKKVFKAKVSIGDEEIELAVGGAAHYRAEEFIGRFVVVCTNLEPRKIGSIISKGMLLAADGPDAKPIFLTITEDAPLGAAIH